MGPATTAAAFYTATPYFSPTPQRNASPRPRASRRRQHNYNNDAFRSRWCDSASNPAAFFVSGIVLLLAYAPPRPGATAVASAAGVARTPARAYGRCDHSPSSRLLTTMGGTAATTRPSPDIAHVRPADRGRRVVRLAESKGVAVTGVQASRAAARIDEEAGSGAGIDEWGLECVPVAEDGGNGAGRYVSPMQTLRNVSFWKLPAVVTLWIRDEGNRLDTPKRGDSIPCLSILKSTEGALLVTVSLNGVSLEIVF